jgi:hypothetical protein
MKKRYWVKRTKPPAHLMSDFGNPAKLQERYVQKPPFRFIPAPPSPSDVEVDERVEESLQIKADCVVRVEGMNCQSEVGEVLCISRNEPTERLKNNNNTIHQRYIAPAEMLQGSSKYIRWTDPYESYPAPKKRVKRSFYGS